MSDGGLPAGQDWAGGAGDRGEAGQIPCHSALGAPVVPSMGVAPLGKEGRLGVGGPLKQRGCENPRVPGSG